MEKIQTNAENGKRSVLDKFPAMNFPGVGLCYKVLYVARALGITKPTVFAMKKRGDLVGRRVGNFMWITKTSIEKYFEGRQ